MKFRYLLIFILYVFNTCIVSAQYFDTGTDPAGIKWMTIKTGKFTLIYPESFGDEGLRYARSLDNSLNKLSSLYPGIKIKIPVVIHNYTAFSNGYVAWAPKRMEIFPTPAQNTIPLDPVDQLTTHELTHVMQLYSLKKGLLNFLTIIGGEQVTGASAIFLPMWFMEGDAVFSETALTMSGRGRTPSFQKQTKAVVTARKKLYSYDKMMFGSFRDFTPDHYQFGYQIAAWSSSKYTHDIWNKALSYTAKYPFTLNPVLFSLKKSTGQTKEGLYSEAFDSLRIIWNKDLAKANTVDYQTININRGSEYINYCSPVIIGKDSIAAIKTSLKAPPIFVLLNPSLKTEKRLFIPGPMRPWFISAAAGRIIWVEERPDPRWENRTYSDIRILDISTGDVTMLSRQSRYMSASFSPDGKFVAAAENTIDNKNRLVIIDAFGGRVLNTVDIPGNAYPQRPQWSASGDKLTIISLTREGEGIMSWSFKTGEWQILIEPARDDLQSSFLRNDTLFYVSSASGTDNIYMLPPSGKIVMVTHSRFGAYDPVLSGSSVWFSDYTPSGYRICSVDPDYKNMSGTGYKMKDSFLINRMDTLNSKKNETSFQDYKPQPYRKILHPFRFHSWMPFYANLEQVQSDPTSIKPGFTIMSQNTLSTVLTTLGYEYSDGRHNFHYKFTWKGWIPVFESRIDYGASPIVYQLGSTVGPPSQLNPAIYFTNSLSLPLSFSAGRFSQYLWGSISVSFQNNYVYLKEQGTYDYGQLQLMPRIYFSNYDISSPRDVYPRWAQVIDLAYITYPIDNTIYGPMTSLRTAFYFPGIIRNHGIRFRYELDYQDPQKLLLHNLAKLPRGYDNVVSLDYKLYSLDYVMPLFYPDFSIPMVLYLKRIRGGLFYDYARGKDNYYLGTSPIVRHNYPEIFRSFGAELLADFYLLRTPFMISGGVQAAWKDFNNGPYLKLLLKIDIFGMKIGKGRI